MKRIFFTTLCVICVLFSVAQPPQTAITIQSANHEHFWLYLNNELQNERSDEAVIVKNLAPSSYNFTIVMDNRQQTTLNTPVQLHTGINYFEVAYQRNTNSIMFRSADKDAEIANQAINAFGNMVSQMNAQYEADVHQQHNGGHHHGHHGNVPPPEPAPAPMPMPCPEHEFSEIKQLIRSETFEDSKLTIANQATSAELLTVDQLAEIASLFTFEDTKLEYLKYAYDYCYDPNKYYKMNKVFTYSSSIDELNEYIKTKR